jgi:MgtC family
MTTLEMGLRLTAGLGLGAVIGMERQWLARSAAMRTDALVTTGAALFVLLWANGFDAGLLGGMPVGGWVPPIPASHQTAPKWYHQRVLAFDCFRWFHEET